MGRSLELSPTSRLLDWPVRYKIENGGNNHLDDFSLQIKFNGNSIATLTDTSANIYQIDSFRGYTIIGTSPYGGYYSECIFYRAVGQLGEIDLFSVVPINDDKFRNLKRVKILLPSPVKKENTSATPKPLTMFQQISFDLISRRIHNSLIRI